MTTFAVIGTNLITERFLTAAKECPNFRLGTVYSRSLERGHAFADRWGASDVCDSMDALCNSPSVRAVYVASPNAFHARQAIQLLRAGKNVLCEKPAAPCADDLEKMFLAAKESGALLLEAMRPAFAPSVRMIRENMARLGPIRRIVIPYCQYSSRYDKFKSGIRENAFDPTLCNGALMDIGVYCVNLMILLAGEPKSILASGYFLKDSIDAYGSAIAEYDGMSVQLMYSKINNNVSPCEIEGEKGSLVFGPMPVPRTAKIHWNNRDEEPLECEMGPHDMRYELERFLAFLEDPSEAAPYQHNSYLALRVMDEIRRQIGIDFQ
mgnify:CR=1 FL=1